MIFPFNTKKKIFYCGLQRTGTKSFSDFFKKNNFKIFSWSESVKLDLSGEIYRGNYDILKRLINKYDVFEDSPFFRIEIIKYISYNFPDSIFVYFERPFEDWFKSMISHSNGNIPGDPGRHMEFYNRLDEYLGTNSCENFKIITNKQAYHSSFFKHQNEVKYFFSNLDEKRFYYGNLYDAEKFKKMSDRLKLKLAFLEDVHIHKSN